jgi:hypothetical protein
VYTVSGHVDIGGGSLAAHAGEVLVSFYNGDADPIFGQTPVPVATTHTDAQGDWTISNLLSDNYIVQLHDTSNPSVPDLVVPRLNSTNCIYYTNCSIRVTSDMSGVNASMPVLNTISGRAALDSGAPVAGVTVTATRFDPDTGNTVSTTTATTAADGTYSFSQLVDGTYAVSFTSPSPDLAFQWYHDESIYYVPDPVTLSDGDTASGVGATLHLAATITGTVAASGGTAADFANGDVTVEVVVYDYQSHTWVQTGDAYPVTSAGGAYRYRIPSLAPDTYRVRFLYNGTAGSAVLVSPRIAATAGSASTYDARINVTGVDSTDIGLDPIAGSKLGITVSGWAVEPSSPSTHVGLALNVGLNWYTVTADQQSADAVEAEADYVTVGPDHGFSSTIPMVPGTYNACLWTSEPNGRASVLVTCQTVTVAPQARTTSHIDAMTGSFSGLSFSGYALFPDNDAASVGVAINIGSSWYGFTANLHSVEGASDVPGVGTEHGFQGTIPLAPGTYSACLWVSEPTGPAADAGCRTVVIPSPRPAAAHIDSVTSDIGTVSVAGWDLFPDTPETAVGLAINIGTAWYSMAASGSNTGSLTAFPAAGSNHGFASTVPAPAGSDSVCIWTVEPAGPAVNLGCRTVSVPAPRPAAAHIDSMTSGIGTVSVAGWDLFPDAATTPVSLAINIGASWYSMTANGPNSGSLTAFPSGGSNHGFSSTVAAPSGTYSVCIWTVEPAGPAVNIGCRTVTVPAPRPADVHIDSVTTALGSLTVSGWDVFPDALNTQVGLAINTGSSWYSMTANTPNSGSASAYPASTVDHGYTSTLSITPGTYSVCIWTVEPAGPAVNIGCRTVTVPAPRPAVTFTGPMTGGITSISIGPGWDYFPDSPATSVHLAVSLDDGTWTSVTADQYYSFYSPDQYPSAGPYHAFSITIPSSPGEHTACVWTTEPSGPAVRLGCQTVVVANSQGVAAAFQSVLATTGGLQVFGYSKWLLSPDTLVNVSANIGGQWYGFTANQQNGWEPGHGVLGFIPVPPGNYTVCLWSAQPSGPALNLGCKAAFAYHIAG